MKKNLKRTLAKVMAGIMVLGILASATPASISEAAAKPKMTKKTSVTVGKKKTLKVTGVKAKKIKKTKWTVKAKKIATISKKKKNSVVVTGKKKGKTTVTAKVKVGKKTTTLKCTVTVNPKKSTKTAAPKTAAPKTATPKPAVPTATPWTIAGKTIDEAATYDIPITTLNETTLTSTTKRGKELSNVSDVLFENNSVTWTSTGDYNGGASFYFNPCTDESTLKTDTTSGFKYFESTPKELAEYDYLYIQLESNSEMNVRLYNDPNDFVRDGAWPNDGKQAEMYEGDFDNAKALISGTNDVVEGKEKRDLYIPLSLVVKKVDNTTSMKAIAISPQKKNTETKMTRISLLKVKLDKPVTGITLSTPAPQGTATPVPAELANKIAFNKSLQLNAEFTPADASRQLVDWTSSDDTIATVNLRGMVTASADKTGSVTITATAKDGSGVKGTYTVEVIEPTDGGPKTFQMTEFAEANAISMEGCTTTNNSYAVSGGVWTVGTTGDYNSLVFEIPEDVTDADYLREMILDATVAGAASRVRFFGADQKEITGIVPEGQTNGTHKWGKDLVATETTQNVALPEGKTIKYLVFENKNVGPATLAIRSVTFTAITKMTEFAEENAMAMEGCTTTNNSYAVSGGVWTVGTTGDYNSLVFEIPEDIMEADYQRTMILDATVAGAASRVRFFGVDQKEITGIVPEGQTNGTHKWGKDLTATTTTQNVALPEGKTIKYLVFENKNVGPATLAIRSVTFLKTLPTTPTN